MTETALDESSRRAVEPNLDTDLAYSGVGIRAVAQFIDWILLSIAFWILGTAIASAVGGLTPTGFGLEGGPAFLFMLVYAAVVSAYFILLEGTYGQTVGKRLTGIRVVREDGSPCDMSASVVRNVLRVVDGFLFYLVGVVLIVLSPTKQRLGDRVADTVVVKQGWGHE